MERYTRFGVLYVGSYINGLGISSKVETYKAQGSPGIELHARFGVLQE